MTIKELIECLNAYPSDLPVLASWEGVYVSVERESISTELYGTWNREQKEHLILFDDQ